jgi:mannobiose 2-epimerase
MARASGEGLKRDGSLIYEFESDKNHYIKEKHWWVQAEAMVGYFNAYQLSHEKHFYTKFLAVRNFTETHIIDQNKGEWFWGVNEDYSLMQEEDKTGLWKCPYHNSRTCLEIINRLDKTPLK